MLTKGRSIKNPIEINYDEEKKRFLEQFKNKRTKRFYNNALVRWEKFSLTIENRKKFWETNRNEINGYVKYYLKKTTPPTAFYTIKRDIAVFAMFYDHLSTHFSTHPNPFRSKNSLFHEELKKNSKYKLPKKFRIPNLNEIQTICEKTIGSTLFAVKIAYRHGLLPKDFEWIEIIGDHLELENGEKIQLTSDLKELLKYWEKELRLIGGYNRHFLIDKWNIQIADRIRKLTKLMKEDGVLEEAYTLTDIKRYFDYGIAKYEKG